MRENAPNCVRRLHAARVILKTRKPVNETNCYAEAIEECTIALKELAYLRTFDANVDQSISLIRQTIHCGEVLVWDQRGKSYARAEQLSTVDRAVFENAIATLLSFLDSGTGAKFLLVTEQERREGAA